MYDVRPSIDINSSRFMDQLRIFIRSRHYVFKTEKTYCYWALSYIRFHQLKHPNTMGKSEIESFLEYLSADQVHEVITLSNTTVQLDNIIYKAVFLK